MKGYGGRVAIVDLDNGSISAERLDEGFCRRHLGGHGMAHALAARHIPQGADPFGPENAVIISSGLLSGTVAPGAGKVSATSRLPLPNAIGTCSGSMVSHRLKYSGFDHVVIKGSSAQPVCLLIRNGQVSVAEASEVWGMTVPQFRFEMEEQFGTDIDTIAIGPAGERKVKFAIAVINRGITLGRGGLGAVFGAKKLKGVVVQGNGAVDVHDPKAFLRAIRRPLKSMMELKYRDDWLKFGPAVALMKFGVKPDGSPAPALNDKGVVYKTYACPSCPLAEKARVCVTDEPLAGCEADMAFYPDAINVWTSRFAAGGLRESVELRSMANDYGVDDYTAAWMAGRIGDLLRKGVVSPDKIPGINFDNPFEAASSIIESIASRIGLGDAMAGGPEAMYDALDVPEEHREQTIKHMDPMFDPRLLFNSIMISQSVNPRGSYIVAGLGPDFLPGRTPEQLRKYLKGLGMGDDKIQRIVSDKPHVHTGRLCAHAENRYSLISSLGVCARQPVSQAYSLKDMSAIVEALTGMELSPVQLMECGERSWNMLRMLNARDGFSRADDVFPENFHKPQDKPPHLKLRDYYGNPMTDSDVKEIFDGYYDERGWDTATGQPTKEKLSALGIKEFP